MIEGVQVQHILEKVEQSVSTETTQLRQPADEDVSRFNEALNPQGSIDPNQQAAQAHAAPPAQAPVQETMGDAILNTFEKMRTVHNEKLEQVSRSMESLNQKQEYSPQDILKLQWQLFQATFQLDVTTKMVDKTDQGVSTLLRSQG